jgi:hypothetical protein
LLVNNFWIRSKTYLQWSLLFELWIFLTQVHRSSLSSYSLVFVTLWNLWKHKVIRFFICCNSSNSFTSWYVTQIENLWENITGLNLSIFYDSRYALIICIGFGEGSYATLLTFQVKKMLCSVYHETYPHHWLRIRCTSYQSID